MCLLSKDKETEDYKFNNQMEILLTLNVLTHN